MDHKSDRSHHPHKSQGRFLDGLLIGLILGFGLALLITTKKGRKMLKTLTEEGIDSVSDLKKRLDKIEVIMDDEAEADEEYIVEEIEEEIDSQTNGVAEKEAEPAQKKSSRKKLFKGISRKN